MSGRAAFRGQPLLVIALLLAGWSAMRVATWSAPDGPGPGGAPLDRVWERPAAPALADAGTREARSGPASPPQATGGQERPAGSSGDAVPQVFPPPILRSLAPAEAPTVPAWPPALPLAPAPRHGAEPLAPRVVVGHNLLLAAGLSQMEVPAELLAYLQRPGSAVAALPAAAAAGGVTGLPALARGEERAPARRWSADGWVLLRSEDSSPALSARPTYGRSQAGAVLRYALAPGLAQRPQAFLRASSALAGARERELAAGLSARPLARVPVRAVAELRVADREAGAELRPAAYLVSEFPPLKLPLGGRAEIYLAAGRVGGDFSSNFAEGQARIERPLARLGTAEVSAGAGAWGGAQRGAARLDVGPTAALSFQLGQASSRLAVDYRFRVAGDAEPASGPALTLSAGF